MPSRFGSRGKFNAQPVEHDGYGFDSTAEGNRYLELKVRLLAGQLTGMRPDPFDPPLTEAELALPLKKRRVRRGKRLWTLLDAPTRADRIMIELDFELWTTPAPDLDGAPDEAEDYKGSDRTITDGFKLKARLWKHCYPTIPLYVALATGDRYQVPPFPSHARRKPRAA